MEQVSKVEWTSHTSSFLLYGNAVLFSMFWPPKTEPVEASVLIDTTSSHHIPTPTSTSGSQSSHIITEN